MKSYYLLPLLLLLTGCPDKDEKPEYHLNIHNNSSIDILYGYDKLYPDTSLWDTNPFTELNIDDFTIIAGDTAREGFFAEEFEQLEPNGKIRLFLFEKEQISSLPWDTVRKNYLVLDRYFLNLDDLENIDWTITYP